MGNLLPKCIYPVFVKQQTNIEVIYYVTRCSFLHNLCLRSRLSGKIQRPRKQLLDNGDEVSTLYRMKKKSLSIKEIMTSYPSVQIYV